MVATIAGTGASVPRAKDAPLSRDAAFSKDAAALDALALLSRKREKTEAEQKLDSILTDMRSSKSRAAKEAARRKLQQIKAKLEALKLAAGSAAASGNARLAAKVARDIRDAARELSKALAAAGEGGGGGGVMAVPATPPAPAPAPKAEAGAAGTEVAPVEASTGAAPAEDAKADESATPEAKVDEAKPGQVKISQGDDDLAALKSEAAGIAKELKKIMRKLREVAMHRLDDRERAEMDKIVREADREIAGLDAAAMPTTGMTVNISA